MIKETKIKLVPEQKKALDLMLSGKNVFLTGKAGTGKSTVLQKFQETCKRKCVFLAPTGIAAINIDGTTIHSFFQLKPSLQTPESIEEISNRKRIDLIRNVETIVIDEISMVRSDLFSAINTRLQEVTEIDKPFGGKQIILIGDFFQLPPVIKSAIEATYLDSTLGGFFAFQTKLWKQAHFQCVCLQTIHRQKNDTLFMAILNHLRYGELEKCDLLPEGFCKPMNVIETLTRLCVNQTCPTMRPVYLCTTNRDADSLNHFHQSKLNGDAHVFRAVVRGKFYGTDYPTPEMLSLKVGARVITLTNKRTQDGEIEYVNGEIGVVEAIEDGDNSTVYVRLDRGATVPIQRTKWSKYEYDLEIDANSGRAVIRQHEVGTFVQIPLKLAYAVTIHKAQGLTLDCVEVKLGNGCFASGQLYTALSRCRSIKNLRIDRPICPADAVIDPAVINFYREIEAEQHPEHKEVTTMVPNPKRSGKYPQHPITNSEKLPDCELPEQSSEENRSATNPDIDHLLVVYRNQNADEKHERSTKRVNGIGFNKQDAPVLTELAEEYLENGSLTASELETVHRLIAKYRRQWA